MLPLDIGGDVWPLATEFFARHLQQEANNVLTGQHRGGVAAAAASMREQLRKDMCVGKSEAVPEAPLKVDLPCCEQHLGLCRGHDALIMPAALDLASAAHSFFNDAVPGNFYEFVVSKQDDPDPPPCAVALRRWASESTAPPPEYTQTLRSLPHLPRMAPPNVGPRSCRARALSPTAGIAPHYWQLQTRHHSTEAHTQRGGEPGWDSQFNVQPVTRTHSAHATHSCLRT